jgi:uncharacterized protein (DUF433 family)
MLEETIIHSIDLIVSNPNIRSGRPVLAGTTLCVSDIAIQKIAHHRDPDEIAEYFQISLPQVYAALAYYCAHKAEIDADIHDRQCIAAEYKAKRIGSRHNPPLLG